MHRLQITIHETIFHIIKTQQEIEHQDLSKVRKKFQIKIMDLKLNSAHVKQIANYTLHVNLHLWPILPA